MGGTKKRSRRSLSGPLCMFLLWTLLCMLLIHMKDVQFAYGFIVITSKEIHTDGCDYWKATRHSCESRFSGNCKGGKALYNNYSTQKTRRAALIAQAKMQNAEGDDDKNDDSKRPEDGEKKQGGVSKLVGRVGRLLESRKKETKTEEASVEQQKSKQKGKENFFLKRKKDAKKKQDLVAEQKDKQETKENFIKKAIRGVTRSDDKKDKESKQDDSTIEDPKTKDENIVEKVLRKKKKDPIETLLISIEDDSNKDEELDLARLNTVTQKVDKTLLLVRQTLEKYRKSTFSLEEARTVDDEIRKLTQIRRELEKRRKTLLLLKTKLELEAITVQKETVKSTELSEPKNNNNEKLFKLNKDNNSTLGMMSGAQNLVSNVLDSMLSKKNAKDEWVVLCPKTRISPGEVVPIVAGGLDLLIIASRDGEKVYCVANSCPHLGTPLETGMVERRPIEFKSSSSDKLRTGNALLATDEKDKKKKKKSRIDSSDKGIVSSNSDGCEECIVCPLHKTAFALESGEVRGEWCPYPPVLGKVMGNVKRESNLPTFSMRIRGKNIEVKLNSSLEDES